MAVSNEGKHRGEFILSEAPGTRSRATGTVVSGQNLVAGQLVKLDGGGKLTALTNAKDTAGNLTDSVVGIMEDNVNASSTGPYGAGDRAGAVYIARDAEVNQAELTFPAEDTAADVETQAVTQLAGLGIICR